MMASSDSTGGIVLEILFFVLVGAGLIVAAVSQKRTARKRALDLQELSIRLGFESFHPGRDEAFAMGWGFLHRLSQCDARYAFNILRGKYHEQLLFVFDFHYQTGSGKSTKQHELTMLMLVFKEVFPQVTIQPGGESLFAKMASAFGGEDDIQFESAEFSRNFTVRSKDRRFAYDVCNPQMIEYLLANPGLQVEIQGPVLLLAFEPQLAVGQIEFNLQRLIEIHSRLPEYLFANK
jgi:hypothetical protein